MNELVLAIMLLPAYRHQPIPQSNHRENRTSIEPIEQQKLRTNRVKPYRLDRTALGDANESNEGGELLRDLEFTQTKTRKQTPDRLEEAPRSAETWAE